MVMMIIMVMMIMMMMMMMVMMMMMIGQLTKSVLSFVVRRDAVLRAGQQHPGRALRGQRTPGHPHPTPPGGKGGHLQDDQNGMGFED
jgi:hypothetical protein